jgi:DNA-binding XRE family transcriptional regulator
MSSNEAQSGTQSGASTQTVTDKEFITHLAQHDRPLQTAEVAESVGVARSTAYERLAALSDGGPVRSWLVTNSARVWTIRGHWGDTSLLKYYPADTDQQRQKLKSLINNGEFDGQISRQEKLEILMDALEAFCLKSSPEEAPLFIEWKQISSLFTDVDPWSLSPALVDKLARQDDATDFRFVERSGTEQNQSAPSAYSQRYEAWNDAKEENEDSNEALDDNHHKDFRERRQQQGITQEELAAETGVSESYISHWERGCRDLSPSTVENLEHALQELN